MVGKMQKHDKKLILINLLTVVLFLIGVMQSSDLILALAVALIVFVILKYREEEVFYLFIAIVPFQSYIALWGRSAFPLLLIVLLVKKFIKNNLKISKQVLFPIFVILIITLFNEFTLSGFWNIVSWCSFAIMVVLLAERLNVEIINVWWIIINFYFGILAAIYANIGAVSFVDSEIERLGSEYISLGGAMGIPLYILLITSMLLVVFIHNTLRRKQKCFVILNIVFLNAIALLSISRAYLLGIATIIGCMLLGLFTKKGGAVARLVIIVAVIALLVVWLNYDELLLIIQRFQYRFEVHVGDDGRTDIWFSCIEYLGTHIKTFLFGDGILSYQNINSEYAYYQYTAHNIYLDCLMAFGMIGTVCILQFFVSFWKKCKKRLRGKADIISFMPFLTLSVYYVTSGSFRYFKTWIYYLIVIYFIYAFRRKIVEGEVKIYDS